MEHNNGRNTNRKYAIRGLKRKLPCVVSAVICLCCCCIYFLKISAKRKWNWMLVKNEQNKMTSETLIVNTPLDILNSTYPIYWCFWFCCSIVCDFTVLIIWKQAPKQMKLKVSVKWTEQKKCRNNHHKYFIRGLGQHLPYDVAAVILFVVLLSLLF